MHAEKRLEIRIRKILSFKRKPRWWATALAETQLKKRSVDHILFDLGAFHERCWNVLVYRKRSELFVEKKLKNARTIHIYVCETYNSLLWIIMLRIYRREKQVVISCFIYLIKFLGKTFDNIWLYDNIYLYTVTFFN